MYYGETIIFIPNQIESKDICISIKQQITVRKYNF